MTKKKLIAGSRESILALTQTRYVRSLIKKKFSDIEIEIKIIKTQGDKITDVPLSKVEGKGFFVKEIEEELLAEKIDFAVHSGKDVPTDLPEGLTIAAYLKREAPFDVIITNDNSTLNSLKKGSIIGTSSLRRKSQILSKYKKFLIQDLRGNLDTRIKKLNAGQFDAIILASAGLKRLGLNLGRKIPYEILLPAVAQGAIMVETQQKNKRTIDILKSLNHFATEVSVKAERKFLQTLEGGCQVPVAALATTNKRKEEISLKGRIISLDGNVLIEGIEIGSIYNPEHIGEKLAEKLLVQGGYKILKEVRSEFAKQN